LAPGSKPFFIIVAGPNGAGKSLLSEVIVKKRYRADPFDWDKAFYAAWARFNYDDNSSLVDGLRDATSEKFILALTGALAARASFAYETNFHDRRNLQWLEKARKAGHETRLIFLCLSSEKLAQQRVQQRVSEGGHSVGEVTVADRFEKGLAYLDASYQKFDKVYLYDNSLNWKAGADPMRPVAKITDGRIIRLTDYALLKKLKKYLPRLHRQAEALHRKAQTE